MASAERGRASGGRAASSADDADGLGAFMADFDAAGTYRTRRLMKENPWERTELVEDEAGKLYTRKCLRVEEAGGAHPYERIAGLSCPSLPHVVSARRTGDELVVICDWIEGHDLQELYRENGPLSHDEVIRAFDDVCEAARALHEAPGGAIVHRDINPSNVVWDGSHAHLIDLGIARAWREGAGADTHLWGTAGYAAPEQYGFGQSDERADVFALGKLLRFLLTGKHPDEDLERPLPLGVRQVIGRACEVDPRKRYRSAEALRRAADCCLVGSPGPVAWRPHEHPVLWYLWCVVAWAFFGFMVYGSVGAVVTGTSPPQYAPAYLALDGLSVFVPVVLLTGSFGVTERIAWFREQRRARIAAVTLASVFAGLLLCGILAGWWS